jgi:hypothetical protein
VCQFLYEFATNPHNCLGKSRRGRLKPNANALRGDANDGAPQTEPLPEIPMPFKCNQFCKDYCDNVLCRAAAQRAVSDSSSNAPQPLGDFANQGFATKP